MRLTKTLLIVMLTVLCCFGDAVVNLCYAAPAEVTAVAKKKKKKKKKKKQTLSKKAAAATTHRVVGYKSLVKEKTPEQLKAEQDSLAEVRKQFLATDSVYLAVDVKPEFPGGEDAMYEYINQHLEYPTDAFEMGIQGSVDVYFVVRVDGTITDAEAHTGAWPSLKEEAVRIVSSMPLWTPGQRDGQPVSYRNHIRVMFLRTGNLSGY